MNETKVYNHYALADIAGTVSEILGIEPPAGGRTTIKPLIALADGRKADKLLMYNPDAVAMWLWRSHPDYFIPVTKLTQLTMPMHSHMVSVTPVNFASIYTGYVPEEHGIVKYEKPVLKCDTLFDAFLRAGKKVDIVAVKDCSIARIFLERELDYFITESDEESINKGIELLESGEYDCITIYNGSYDSTMHRTGVLDEKALEILDRNAIDFDRCVKAAFKGWAGSNILYGWVTDHGCHDTEAGRGSHGTDTPEDMNVTHFWGFKEK